LPAFHAPPTRSTTRSRGIAAAALVALALAAGGCSSSSDSSSPDAGPTTGGSDAGGPRPVASKVVLGRVAGNLHQPNKRIFKKHRKHTLEKVGRAVDTWIDGGFVAVRYPRIDLGSAFRAFTAPATHDAKKQRALMTNWDLRKRIDGVEVKKRHVTVDVFAPHGRPAGATARVALVFRTTGDVTKRVAVHGRLFLNPDDHGSWRIFGYDVARGGKR
jgi:hypothetical protein